jgi:hypothetical protein
MRYLVLIPFLFVVFATKTIFAEQITMRCGSKGKGNETIYRYIEGKGGNKQVLQRIDGEWLNWFSPIKKEFKPSKQKITQKGAVFAVVSEGEFTKIFVKQNIISILKTLSEGVRAGYTDAERRELDYLTTGKYPKAKQTDNKVPKTKVEGIPTAKVSFPAQRPIDFINIQGFPSDLKVGDRVLVKDKYVLDFEFLSKTIQLWVTKKDGTDILAPNREFSSSKPNKKSMSCIKL